MIVSPDGKQLLPVVQSGPGPPRRGAVSRCSLSPGDVWPVSDRGQPPGSLLFSVGPANQNKSSLFLHFFFFLESRFLNLRTQTRREGVGYPA